MDSGFLYSAGVEGVIVMWHLKEQSRSFLPRIGGAIQDIWINEGNIVCSLADNSVKLIQLGLDKAIKTYKILLNSDN